MLRKITENKVILTVGRLGSDQVEAYARRSGYALAEMERWLAPNLAYEPDA